MLKKHIIYVLFVLIIAVKGKSEASLFIHDHLFAGAEVTAITEWNDKLWVATDKGLFRVDENDYTSVSIPSAENDKITSLDNSSPFNLVCGTYRGKIIMVSEGEKDYCGQEWTMKPSNLKDDYYVSATANTKDGLWITTLEYGALLLNPTTKVAMNFPLDYGNDLNGINAYNVLVGQEGEVWVHGQDGLYFINRVFGKSNSLEYFYSKRAGKQVKFIAQGDNSIYLATKKRKGLRLAEVQYSNNFIDYRIKNRIKLPEYFNKKTIQAFTTSQSKIWILGDMLYQLDGSKNYKSFELPSEIHTFKVVSMSMKDGFVWVATENDGIYKLGFQEKKIEQEQVTFNNEVVEDGKLFELDKVFFEAGDSLLSSVSYNQLGQLAYLLRSYPQATIVLKGHTANDGNADYLYNLSLARANSVKQFLVTKGIDAKRIKTIAYGATQPKDVANKKAAINRRVELVINFK